MLQVCGFGKGRTPGGGMSLAEYRAHYSVWAILASPLVLGTDLRSLASDHPDCLALLLNKDIVAVNQDAGGLPPRLVAQMPPFGSAVLSFDPDLVPLTSKRTPDKGNPSKAKLLVHIKKAV